MTSKRVKNTPNLIRQYLFVKNKKMGLKFFFKKKKKKKKTTRKTFFLKISVLSIAPTITYSLLNLTLRLLFCPNNNNQ